MSNLSAVSEYSYPLHLFSLVFDENLSGDQPLDRISSTVRQKAESIIHVSDNEIHATFRAAAACFQTAQKVIEDIYILLYGRNLSGAGITIGLHTIEGAGLSRDDIIGFFDLPIKIRDYGNAGDIIMSPEFYASLPQNIRNNCAEHTPSSGSDSAVYIHTISRPRDGDTAFEPLLEAGGGQAGGRACFYCGVTEHRAAECPSKFIDQSTSCLEEIGYLPLEHIRGIVNDGYQDIVRPMQSGSEDSRFSVLLDEESEDHASRALFAFYEIRELFQLRTLKKVFTDAVEGKSSESGKSASVMMGLDCLRVSRHEEAGEWFEKAIAENPNDFRPRVALALVAMEQEAFQSAFAFLRKAFSFCETQDQESFIHRMYARLHEILGAPFEAKQEVEEALKLSSSPDSLSYYFSEILAQNNEAGRAVDMLKRLVDQSPRYYMAAALDPAFSTARDIITGFLSRELDRISENAREDLQSIQGTIDDYQDSVSPEDEHFVKALEIYRTAEHYYKDQCISGMLDMPGMLVAVTQLLRRMSSKSRDRLNRQVAEYESLIGQHERYLKRYPYKAIILPADYSAFNSMSQLIHQTKSELRCSGTSHMNQAKEYIGQLSGAAVKIKASRNRLDIYKKAVFVLECIGKAAGFFFVSSFVTAVFFSVLLMLYQAVSGSASGLSVDIFVKYIQYGFFIGIFSGVFVTAFWMRRNIDKLKKKIQV